MKKVTRFSGFDVNPAVYLKSLNDVYGKIILSQLISGHWSQKSFQIYTYFIVS